MAVAATWRHPLRSYIDRLKDIRTALHDPAAFYAQRREEYVAIAQRVANAVLLLGRPLDIPAEEWMFRVGIVVSKIGAVLVSGEETGLSIYLLVRRDEQVQMEEIGGAPPGIFAKDTVLNWVRAGRNEDPLGKQFDDRDFGESDDAIASRVWWALYTGRSLNSADLIRRYLTGKTQEAAMALLPAVLKAWRETFTAIVGKDLRQWVRGVIKNPR